MKLHKEELAQAKKSFVQWRREKKHSDKIPVNLWDEACRCADLLGSGPVAAALSLNCSQLKLQRGLRQVGQCESRNSPRPLVPVNKEVEPRHRVTVTKIVSLESAKTSEDTEIWSVVSPDGWKFSGKGAGSEQALRVFVETVSQCGVKS